MDSFLAERADSVLTSLDRFYLLFRERVREAILNAG